MIETVDIVDIDRKIYGYRVFCNKCGKELKDEKRGLIYCKDTDVFDIVRFYNWFVKDYSVECLCEKCYYLCYPADCPYIRGLGFNLDDFDFYSVDVQNEIRNLISKWYDTIQN